MIKMNNIPIIGSLIFVGDVFLNKGDTIHIDKEILRYFHSCDIRSCNIEAPLESDIPAVVKAGPTLQQSKVVVKEMERNGFNLVCLANNHIMDHGKEALVSTLDTWHIPCIGAGMDWYQATRPYIVEIGKMKVGFMAFGEAEFGAIIEDSDAGFAWVNHPDTNNIIRQTKKECDILILQIHAGIELMDLPLPEWRRRYKELIDCGADAIVATHPHIPQGWEMYKGHPIFYSLGNFFFNTDHTHPFWNKGLVALINIHEDKSLSIEVKGVQRQGNTIQAWEDEEFHNHTNTLCHKIQESDYENNVNLMAVDLWNRVYRRHYENGINGVSSWNLVHLMKFVKRLFVRKALDIPMLLHNTRIESHHWIVVRALNQIYKKQLNHGK